MTAPIAVPITPVITAASISVSVNLVPHLYHHGSSSENKDNNYKQYNATTLYAPNNADHR